MPRRCTVCARSDVKEINSAICNNSSYRSIAQQQGIIHTTLQRHIENCLHLELGAIQNGHRLKQAVDVYEEFEAQLAFARDLREAAKKWLLVQDQIDLDPRESEVHVVYYDPLITNDKGEPQKAKASLEALLRQVQGIAFSPSPIVKTVDLRKFALDAINTTDTCIDKFAKLAGLYVQDKKNPADARSYAQALVKELEAQGYDTGQIKSTLIKLDAQFPGYAEVARELGEVG